MFDSFFSWIRDGVKRAVLGGLQDAADEVNERCAEPRLLADPHNRIAEVESNGKRQKISK